MKKVLLSVLIIFCLGFMYLTLFQDSTNIKVIDVEKPALVAGRDQAIATLVFNKQIHNKEGKLIIDGISVNLWPVNSVCFNEMTWRLEAQWSPNKNNLNPNHLKGKTGVLIQE